MEDTTYILTTNGIINIKYSTAIKYFADANNVPIPYIQTRLENRAITGVPVKDLPMTFPEGCSISRGKDDLGQPLQSPKQMIILSGLLVRKSLADEAFHQVKSTGTDL